MIECFYLLRIIPPELLLEAISLLHRFKYLYQHGLEAAWVQAFKSSFIGSWVELVVDDVIDRYGYNVLELNCFIKLAYVLGAWFT